MNLPLSFFSLTPWFESFRIGVTYEKTTNPSTVRAWGLGIWIHVGCDVMSPRCSVVFVSLLSIFNSTPFVVSSIFSSNFLSHCLFTASTSLLFSSYISYTLLTVSFSLCCPSSSHRDGLRSTSSRVFISCYSMWARNSHPTILKLHVSWLKSSVCMYTHSNSLPPVKWEHMHTSAHISYSLIFVHCLKEENDAPSHKVSTDDLIKKLKQWQNIKQLKHLILSRTSIK